jgi:hypothetical protein
MQYELARGPHADQPGKRITVDEATSGAAVTAARAADGLKPPASISRLSMWKCRTRSPPAGLPGAGVGPTRKHSPGKTPSAVAGCPVSTRSTCSTARTENRNPKPSLKKRRNVP